MPRVTQGNEMRYCLMANSVTRALTSRACFSVTEEQPGGREIHKQASTKGGCNKDLAEQESIYLKFCLFIQ